jgi:hypothetical protein
MYWPHIWWLNKAVTRGVDCNERLLYAALIIHCVDCSVAESIVHYKNVPLHMISVINSYHQLHDVL